MKGKGIKGLELGSNPVVQGDPHIDCTDLDPVTDKTLKELESFAPCINNRAWVTRMPTQIKENKWSPQTVLHITMVGLNISVESNWYRICLQ